MTRTNHVKMDLLIILWVAFHICKYLKASQLWIYMKIIQQTSPWSRGRLFLNSLRSLTFEYTPEKKVDSRACLIPWVSNIWSVFFFFKCHRHHCSDLFVYILVFLLTKEERAFLHLQVYQSLTEELSATSTIGKVESCNLRAFSSAFLFVTAQC